MEAKKDESCFCSQLRRTARLISILYDDALAPAGVTVTQYTLLAKIGRADGLSRTALAGELGMDRTTLTRNLAPLEKARLIANNSGEDRREKLLRLTADGRKRLASAKPRWREAQEQMLSHLGANRWRHLQELLLYTDQVSSKR
jgi:DNA-binding MarR family transcriptional regulator